MKQLINEIASLAAQEQSFVLATVITRNGSAPRSAGAKMLVREDGSTLGTVGGGILEAQVEQLAVEILKSHEATIRSFQFSGKDAATMDAICGGQVEVLVEWWDMHDPLSRSIVTALHDALDNHKKAWLVTELHSNANSRLTAHHALLKAGGDLNGEFPPGLAVDTVTEVRHPELIEISPSRCMVEPIDISGTAYIFGAGHVSRCLAEFTNAVGFWTVVLDDRSEYANRTRFPSAAEVMVLDSFERSIEKVQVDIDSFIVIVTRGHLNDRTVLAQALRTRAGYIGMIGSRRKTALVFEELRKAGFSEEDLQRVHAPIGLSISAETPEEIGISIVAEMIQVRAGLLKTR
jgi:xanthine dehydrogenase accessory factor